VARHLSRLAPGLDIAAEEGADLVEVASHHPPDLGVVWRDIEGRVHQQAAATIRVLQRAIDDLRQEGADRLLRLAPGLEAADALPHGAAGVALKGPREQGALVAVGIVEAGPADPHGLGEV